MEDTIVWETSSAPFDPCLHELLGWPWIFIVEGTITVLFGILTMFFLPHTPSQSKLLTEEERNGAIHRMTLDAHGASAASDVASPKFSWRWLRVALLNWNTILLSITFFLLITPIYSYSLFLPTIISTLGYKRVTAQLFTVPPNIGAVVSVPVVTYLRTESRFGALSCWEGPPWRSSATSCYWQGSGHRSNMEGLS